jgi:PAS domain S-box-containing protein
LADLRNSEHFLSEILFNLNQAVLIIDLDGNFIRMNKMAEEICPLKQDNVVGKSLMDVCLIENKAVFQEILQRLMQSNKDEAITFQNVLINTKSGEQKIFDIKVSIVYLNNSFSAVAIILFNDLTELVKSYNGVKRTETNFRMLVDYSSEGIWRYDLRVPIHISLPVEEQIKLIFEHCYLADCNDAFVKMYGFSSKDEIIGSLLSEFLITDDENNFLYLKSFIENNYKLTNTESSEIDRFGNHKYFLNSLYGIIENGFLLGAWGLQFDITEDKLTTQEIRRNNKLLNSLLNAPKGMIIFSLDNNYCYTAFSFSHKETMKKIWGVDIEIGMNMLNAISKESDRIKAKNNFDRTLQGEHLNLVEEYGDDKLSRSFWLDKYSPIYDGNEIIGLVVYVTDISQQKQAEIELEKQNILLNTLINSLPDSIYVKDNNLRRIIVNKSDLESMGLENIGQVLGKRDDEIIGIDYSQDSLHDDLNVLKNQPVINRVEINPIKGDKEQTMLTTKIPLIDNQGEVIGLVGIRRDITETMNYLNKLKQEEEKLQILFNQSFQFIGLLTTSGILLEANQTACDFIGVSIEEVKNKPFIQTPWWTHSKSEQDKLSKALRIASEGNFYRMETTHLNKNGELRIIDFSVTPVKSFDGNILNLIAEGRDITEIKVLQNKLAESEDKYRILIEASMDAISIINEEGVVLFSNEKHKELFNQVKPEVKNNYFNLVFSDDRPKIKNEIKNILRNQGSLLLSIRFYKDNESYLWGELNLKSFVDSDDSVLYMCVLRDITFKKQIEDELKKRVFELEKFNKLMIGREVTMYELKKEVNSLLKKFGMNPKYSVDD